VPSTDSFSSFFFLSLLSLHSFSFIGEINAIDDVFYFLERGLVLRKIDLNSFQEKSRALARQQFLYKAHLFKIQNQINSMFVNPSSFPQQLQQQSGNYSSGTNSPSTVLGGSGQHVPLAYPLSSSNSNYPTPTSGAGMNLASPVPLSQWGSPALNSGSGHQHLLHPQPGTVPASSFSGHNSPYPPGMGPSNNGNNLVNVQNGPYIHSMNQHAAMRSQPPLPSVLPGGSSADPNLMIYNSNPVTGGGGGGGGGNNSINYQYYIPK
jgi:hypothetical protein